MKPLFVRHGDDLPLEYDIDEDSFHKYKGSWLLWRSLGRYDSNGSFAPPLSFLEADSLPKSKIDFFLAMDDILATKQRQLANRTKAK